jgi:transcriptional regulator with XRE-family HTH domain
MDVASALADLGISVAELARRVGVSDGHLWDLKSGRRRLTVELAAKIEAATGRRGLVDAVVRDRIAA